VKCRRALLVAAFAVASPVCAWQRFVAFGDPTRLVVPSATFDVFGRLVVVAGPGGLVDNDTIQAVAFAPDGTQRWRSDVAPIPNVFWPAAAASLPDGDVVLAGNASLCECSPREYRFTIARVDGNTGELVWRRTADGAVGGIAVTRTGDVIVSAGGAVFELGGEDGTTHWSTASADGDGSVAVDLHGDVIVFTYAALTKRSGTDGGTLWSIPVARPVHAPLHLLRNGDVLTVERTDMDVRVVRRRGADGGARWHVVIPNGDVGIAVAAGRRRRLVVATPLRRAGEAEPTGVAVLRLDPRSGATIWRSEVPDADTRGTSPAVAVDRHGDGVVYADAARAITRLAGRDGLVRDAIPAYPMVHAVLAVARDGRVALAGQGRGSRVPDDLAVQVEPPSR